MSAAQPLPPAALPVAVGALVAGKYLVEGTLGEGGMGVVLAARHVQIRQRVALKFLRRDLASEADTAARFLREAQAAARISNEHVARVLDVGQLPDGLPFLVMELLDGVDLGQALESRGPLPSLEAVDYVLQALEALAEAHHLGIVHRDLKPGNLFLCRRPDGSPLVKVLDFGLSKDVTEDRKGQSLTRSTSTTMGSPLYMSPEQIRSMKSATFASDQWSIGVVLFELLTDDVPFRAETVGGLLAAVIADPPLSLRQLRPDLPRGLEQVIERCLRKSPAERFPHLGELALALAPFASATGQLSAQRVAGTFGAPAPSERRPERIVLESPSLDAATLPLAVEPRRGRWPVVAASVLGATLLLVAIGFGLRSSRGAAASAPGQPAAEEAARPVPPDVAPAEEPPPDVAPAEAPAVDAEAAASAAPAAAPSASAAPPSPSAPPPSKASSSDGARPPAPRGRPPARGGAPPPKTKPVESLIDSRN